MSPVEPVHREAADAGLADVVTMQSRVSARRDTDDEVGFFHDTLAEYSWARDVAGLAPATLPKLLAPILEVCRFYECVPWRLAPHQLDRYFARPGKRKHSTVRKKIVHIGGYFAFLEQRYRGEIARRFGVTVESPVDAFNRPRHRGDFVRRIPPSRRALREFFQAWRADLPRSIVLDELVTGLTNDWLRARATTWPHTSNPFLFVSSYTVNGREPMSRTGLTIPFRTLGIPARQLRADRILDEARHSADPVQLIRVFGLGVTTAVRYIGAAHPDRSIPDPASA